MTDDTTALSAATPPTPLAGVTTFTFLCSAASAVGTSAIYFLTKHAYGFSDRENFLLGLLQGVTYIAGSLGAGPAIAFLRRRVPSFCTRQVLVVLMILLACLCVMPVAASVWFGFERARMSMWVLMGFYSPLTGVLWPIVESYVAGGRRGPALRGAMGLWNVVWSGALVVGYWAMGPLIKNNAGAVLIGAGVAHVLSLGILAVFQREPGEHAHEAHEPHPPIYAKLLVTFRMLLPMSYVVTSALGPYLPSAMARLDIPVGWQTAVATAWLLPRSIAFGLLERWHGWHGRWATAIAGGTLIIVGFAGVVLAPESGSVLGGRNGAVALLVGSLAVFGCGMAVIYTAAIYYAMAVGDADVDAGGKHEALIGTGYTVGPLIGLAGIWAVDARIVPAHGFDTAVLSLVGVLAVVVAIAVCVRVFRHAGAAPVRS